MNCTEITGHGDRETVQALQEGTAHLTCEPPTAAEIEAMLADVPRESERRWTRWAVAAAAVIVCAVILTTLERPAGDRPPTEHVQAPAEETDDPPPPEEKKPEPEIKTLTLTFEEAWKAADHLKRTLEYDRAIEMYTRIVEQCRTPVERGQHAGRAWMAIGECHYRTKRYLESWRAYGKVYQKGQGAEFAADAAYYRYLAATALFAAERTQENEERKKVSRDDFLRRFPDHPRAVDLGYYIGADWIATGDSMTAAGKAVEARKSYGKALSYLAMVNSKSVLYQKAKARRGEVFYKLGRTDDALGIFRRILTEEPGKTTNPQRLDNQRTARVLAVYYSSMCHREKEEWSELLAVLAGFETKYGKEREGRPFVPSVKLQRIRALLALDRTDDATKQAGSLRADHAKSGAVPLAARLLGRHFFEAGKWEPAAEWLEVVIAEVRKATADDLGLAGMAAEKSGNLERAEKRLAAAVAKREAEIAAETDVIRDQGWTDPSLATYRQALARVCKALDR